MSKQKLSKYEHVKKSLKKYPNFFHKYYTHYFH
jgi:hypothetical protein